MTVQYLLTKKSKCIIALITASFLFASPLLAAELMSVKKDGVNIRSGPDTKDEVRWEVFKDFPLNVIKRQGKWAQVEDFEGDGGWIYAPLLSDNKTVIVKVKTANLRVGPGKNFESLVTVKYGVVFKPIDKEGDWIKVSHEDGTIGWIFNDLIWPSNPL